MKISDVKQIIAISEKEWLYFSQLIERKVKETLGSTMPFLHQKSTLQTISLYSLYPLMFRKEFQFEEKTLENLIVFSHHHFTSLFILDNIYDTQSIEEPIELLILLEQYAQSMSFLNALENKSDVNISGNIAKTLAGLYKEKYVYKPHEVLSPREEVQYTHDKYSFAKIALKVYQERSENPLPNNIMEDLYRSHDFFAYGRQILDDLEDFKRDYENRQFNIYINRYFKKYGKEAIPHADEDLFLDLLIEAKNNFNCAVKTLSYNFSYWVNYINFYLKICEKHININT